MIKGTDLFIIGLFLIVITQQCHYSCQTCTDEWYSSCTTCPQSSSLFKVNGYQTNLIGICKDINLGNINVFGIFLLVVMITSCIIFPTEEIIHFTILIQSFGLLFLVEVLWSIQTHYILSGLSSLMFFTKINYLFIHLSGKFFLFKSQIFFKTTQISMNLSVLGSINLFLLLVMILVPIFKVFRKKINKQRANCLPDVVLSRILFCVNFTYLFLIQQTQVIIFMGLKYGEMNVGDILIVIAYFLSLIFFSINQWFYPFPFFRSKFAQFNIILLKIFSPIFIVSPKEIHYLLFFYLFFFFSIDAMLTNKNRNNNAVNRLFYYKLYSLLAIIVFVIYYSIQIGKNTQNASQKAGIFTTLLICGLLNLFIIQFCIQYKQRYCVQKKKQQKIRQDTIEMTRQQISISKGRADKLQIIYDFTCLPPQNINDEILKSQLICLPLTLVTKHKQKIGYHPQNIQIQSNSAKLSQKKSTNRYNSTSSIMHGPSGQNIDTFEEIQIEIKEKQQNHLVESQIIQAKQKNINEPTLKRRGKKRKRQE